jgi:hypothetical protein
VQVKLAVAISISQKPVSPGKNCIDIASAHAEARKAIRNRVLFKNAGALHADATAGIGRK